MSVAQTPAEQLVEEVQPTLEAVARMLGLNVVDLLTAAHERSRTVLLDVVADPGGAVDVATVLWGGGEPAPEWWSTPLGLTMAAGMQLDHATTVTRQQAARMLGVSPGTVAQLVARGTLARNPSGRIARGSVLARLCRLSARRTPDERPGKPCDEDDKHQSEHQGKNGNRDGGGDEPTSPDDPRSQP